MPTGGIRARTSGIMVPAFVAPVAGAFTGLGDVVGTATAYWGLRAWKNSTIGANAIRLRASGDNAESDFATIAGGGLNTSGISSFLSTHGGSLFVVTWYDQIGTNHVTNSNTTQQPSFSLTGGGTNNLPSITFDGTNDILTGPGTINQATPASAVSFSNNTGGTGDQASMFVIPSFHILGYNTTVPNENLFAFSGSVLSNASNPTATWQALLGVFDTSGVIYADGTSVASGTTGTTTANGVPSIGAIATASQSFKGLVTEVAYYPSGLTSGNATSISANQHTYWG